MQAPSLEAYFSELGKEAIVHLTERPGLGHV